MRPCSPGSNAALLYFPSHDVAYPLTAFGPGAEEVRFGDAGPAARGRSSPARRPAQSAGPPLDAGLLPRQRRQPEPPGAADRPDAIRARRQRLHLRLPGVRPEPGAPLRAGDRRRRPRRHRLPARPARRRSRPDRLLRRVARRCRRDRPGDRCAAGRAGDPVVVHVDRRHDPAALPGPELPAAVRQHALRGADGDPQAPRAAPGDPRRRRHAGPARAQPAPVRGRERAEAPPDRARARTTTTSSCAAGRPSGATSATSSPTDRIPAGR